jgi:hypothetical protein
LQCSKASNSLLGNWNRREQAAVDSGEAGSAARLAAAKLLQARLKLILEGEPPYDIFIRWKPLAQQAIGWQEEVPILNTRRTSNLSISKKIGLILCACSSSKESG